MLRSVPKNLLAYTREGVLIRARYIRQLDNIYKSELAAKCAAKKIIRDLNDKIEVHQKEVMDHAYAKGLQALLSDIIKFSIQYQEKLTQYEFQQREQITAVVAQFFDSPEIQVELTQRLISTLDSEKKITLDIPVTLRRYLEKELNNPLIQLNTHNSKTIAIHAGDQITFFDPALFINDLKSQFHRPFSDTYQATFTQEIKDTLLAFIDTFEISDDIHTQTTDPRENTHED